MHRFYVAPEQWQPDALVLTGSEAHHCCNVLRLEPADRVVLFNGRGCEITAEIVSSDTTEVHQDGFDTGQGSSNSKSIMVAAEKGFQGDDYKQVFTKYHTVAEDDMNQEEVPDGYRFYVKRYFQLIRPRD